MNSAAQGERGDGAISIARHGAEERKRRHLSRLADGGARFCLAITEPDAGGNSFRIRTIAHRASLLRRDDP